MGILAAFDLGKRDIFRLEKFLEAYHRVSFREGKLRIQFVLQKFIPFFHPTRKTTTMEKAITMTPAVTVTVTITIVKASTVTPTVTATITITIKVTPTPTVTVTKTMKTTITRT